MESEVTGFKIKCIRPYHGCGFSNIRNLDCVFSPCQLIVYGYTQRGNGNKNFIVLFERDSKTIYGSPLQNFYTCFISGNTLIKNIEWFAVIDICRYA